MTNRKSNKKDQPKLMKTRSRFVIVSHKYATAMVLCQDGKLRDKPLWWGDRSWCVKIYKNAKNGINRLEKFGEDHHAVMISMPEPIEKRNSPEMDRIEEERFAQDEKWFDKQIS